MSVIEFKITKEAMPVITASFSSLPKASPDLLAEILDSSAE